MTRSKLLRLHKEANRPLPGDMVKFSWSAQLRPFEGGLSRVLYPDNTWHGMIISVDKFLNECMVMIQKHNHKTRFGWMNIKHVHKLS